MDLENWRHDVLVRLTFRHIFRCEPGGGDDGVGKCSGKRRQAFGGVMRLWFILRKPLTAVYFAVRWVIRKVRGE